MRKHNIAAVVLFCGFLLAMGLGYLLLPKVEFSQMEKRYLETAPKLNAQRLFSGQWGKDAEKYLTDHVPGRNLFVGINAYAELLAGRQETKDVWVRGDRLLEAPVALDEKAVTRNMKAINGFSETLGQRVDLMVVPSAGWAAGEKDYGDTDSIGAIYAAAGEWVNPVSVEEVFAGKPELYYRTDHHWTSRGAHSGYRAYMEAIGREWRPETEFQVETIEGFQGSTYSRSALWLTEGEPLELWHGDEGITVTNGESEEVHQGLFYRQRLEEADKYTVFLDGNHSIVRVVNPSQTGKILVIRDSYSNCLGTFLAQSYGEVVLIDLRYYRQAVSELVKTEGFDNILVCYSCANFLTDTNLALLR